MDLSLISVVAMMIWIGLLARAAFLLARPHTQRATVTVPLTHR